LQMTLESLKDPANKVGQESEAVAGNNKTDWRTKQRSKQVVLPARESLRIRARLYADHIRRRVLKYFKETSNLGAKVKGTIRALSDVSMKDQMGFRPLDQ
jgi:t-SNARE complex subunit (syntaxin)